MHLRFFCTTYLTSRILPLSCRSSGQFSFPGKMSSGRGWPRTRDSEIRRGTVGVNRPSPNVSTGGNGGHSHGRGQILPRNIVSEHPKSLSASDVYEEEFPALSASFGSSSKAKRRTKIDLGTQVEQRLEERPGDIGSSQPEVSPVENLRVKEENSLPTSFGKKYVSLPNKRHEFGQTQVERRLDGRPGDFGSSQLEVSPVANFRIKEENSLTSFGKKHVPSPIKRHEFHQTQSKSSLGAGETDSAKGLPEPESFGKKHVPLPDKRHEFGQTHPKYSLGAGETDSAKGLPEPESFDICIAKSGKSPIYLNARIKEKRIERADQFLRPGMVLLKRFITIDEQVRIVKICRDLGLGLGGFYQPGYRDGAKLQLHMMCLGLDWDPESRKYDKKRVVDGSEAPGIPHEFDTLVKRAIQGSQAVIEKNIGLSNVEDLLPEMSPDICIVNFYTTGGRLGLHQDRDESKESIHKGLPVVSFSVGDSAEFLYGDERDVEKAKKVKLESGDVLIFGGKSRNVFHGVQSIIPNSAPAALLRDANLRPGRLNLTFRKY